MLSHPGTLREGRKLLSGVPRVVASRVASATGASTSVRTYLPWPDQVYFVFGELVDLSLAGKEYAIRQVDFRKKGSKVEAVTRFRNI